MSVTLNSSSDHRFIRTKIASAATLCYAGVCVINPDHIALAAGRYPDRWWKIGAYGLALRDVAISSGILRSNASRIPFFVMARIAADAIDAVVLASKASTGTRGKVAGAALGWGALNAAALGFDVRSNQVQQ